MKTILFVICYKLIIFALGVFSSLLLARMVRCWSSSITAVMVLILVAVTTVRGSLAMVRILLTLISLQKIYTTIKSSNHLAFPSQMSPLITWLFHSVYSLSTHKL